MKTNKLVTTLSIGVAALLFQVTSSATQPGAIGYGAVAVHGNVNGNFSIGANGAATSYAQNKEAATAKITAVTGSTPYHQTVMAGVSGATTSDSSGHAYNTSTGSGSGSAALYGFSETLVKGGTAIHGVTNGFSGGKSGTQTGSIIQAGPNQGSYVVSQSLSGFDAEVNYARSAATTPAPIGTSGGSRSSMVSLSTQHSGYASGVNATGALEGMNAAGIANIGASGHFFAKGGLSATVGTVSAP